LVRYLEEEILERLEESGSTSIDPTEVRWQVLHNCVYGFDINPLAVELAKFSLWMYTARAGYQLEPLGDQLVCSDSLVSPMKLLKAVNSSTGFDVVVGNPPYVRQESFVSAKDTLEANFDVHHSMADLYVYFIEQSQKLCREGAKIGLITANKWLKADYGRALRQWVAKNGIERIVDFGDLPVFPGVAAYPAISFLTVGKKFSESVSYFRVRELPETGAKITTPDNAVKIAREGLSSDPWTFEGQAAKKLSVKVAKLTSNLGEVVGEAYRGVLTGCNEAFVVDKETAAKITKSDKASASIIKPFAAGKEIQRYGKVSPQKFLIVARRGIDIKNFPGAQKHLEPFKKALMPKPKDHKGEWPGRKPGKYAWYEIQDAVDYIGLFDKPKISFLVFQVRPSFTYDTKGTLNNNAVWNLDTDDLALLGFLNSRLGWYLISQHCTQIQGGYQLIYKYLSKVPVLDRSKVAPKSIKDLEGLVRKRLEFGSADSPKATAIDNEIDETIYALFSITSAERELIESVSWGGGTRVASPAELDEEAA